MSEVKKLTLDDKEVIDVFINTKLEEDYNFLQDDLVKLANAFIDAARQRIARKERAECIEFVRSINTLVADKLEEKRGKM